MFHGYLNNKYMLFAGWEVRIVKNCGRHKNSKKSPLMSEKQPKKGLFEVTVFTLRTDPKTTNDIFIFVPFFCGKLVYEWVFFK